MTEVEDRYGKLIRFEADHDRQAADRIAEYAAETAPDREAEERLIAASRKTPDG